MRDDEPALTTDDMLVLLAAAARFDARGVDRETAAAWAEALTSAGLTGLDLADAVAVVAVHYGASGEWIKPVHVRDLVHARQVRRIERAPAAVLLMADVDPDDPGWGKALARRTRDTALGRPHGAAPILVQRPLDEVTAAAEAPGPGEGQPEAHGAPGGAAEAAE